MKMTHAIWMKDTAALARPRSTELKQIDNALLAYEKALQDSSGSVLSERRALQQALEDWKNAQTTKGQDWRNSVRNKLKAVEKLDVELGQVIGGAMGLNSRGELMVDPAELKAAKALADDIKCNTRQLFAGQKLTVKNTKALADLNQVRSAMTSFKTAAKQVKEASAGVLQPNLAQQLQGTLVSLFGDATAAQVQEALGPVFTSSGPTSRRSSAPSSPAAKRSSSGARRPRDSTPSTRWSSPPTRSRQAIPPRPSRRFS